MDNQETEQIHYFRIKEFDFNDVFDYSTIVRGTYNQVKNYLINKYKPEYRNKLDIDESSEDIHVLDYMPVTDENGNEVSIDDPRYDYLSETQDVRLSTSFSAELIYNDLFPHRFIDLTTGESVEND